MYRTTVILAVMLALGSCKSDGGGRRDRGDDEPRQEDPSADPPEQGNALAFRSTTGENVREDPPNTFHVPACGRGKLGYVTTRWRAPLAGSAMRLEFSIATSEGASIVGHERRGDQGRLHLHFQRAGDDWSQSKLDAGYRQWSSAMRSLMPGEYELEAPLTAEYWGNRRGFDAAMRNVENVGFTLGDNATKGHGVCVTGGSASLTVRSFAVE